MILGTEKILERLEKGEIFHKGTWESECLKEASYALRVAPDGMVVGGNAYGPGKRYPHRVIKIEPGRIAILSTKERLCMPGDLVGKLGVRLDFASMGLTGLMGIQVDPYYGVDHEQERLYIKVANFGNKTVDIRPGNTVFNVEFSIVEKARKPSRPKQETWYRIRDALDDQGPSDWTYVARVQATLNQRADELQNNQQDMEVNLNQRADDLQNNQQKELSGIRNNQQSVVMFGVFLVAVAILGTLIGVILNVENAPNWVTNWGWIILLALCGISVAALVSFVVVASIGFLKVTNRLPK